MKEHRQGPRPKALLSCSLILSILNALFSRCDISGLSLLTTTSKPPRMGRISSSVRTQDATGSLASSTADAQVLRVVDDSEGPTTEKQPPLENNHRSACFCSHLSSGVRQEHYVAVTRASSNEHTGLKEPLTVQNTGECGSERGMQSAAADGPPRRSNETEEEDQPCTSCSAPLREEAGYYSTTLTRDIRHKARVWSPRGDIGTSSFSSCKLCMCPPLPHGQYYHGAKQQGCTARGHNANNSSYNRSCAPRECSRCCTGTQTPAGWMHPLDLACSNSSSADSEKGDGPEVESAASGVLSPSQTACRSPASTDSGKEQDNGDDSDVKDAVTEGTKPCATDVEAIKSEDGYGGDDECCEHFAEAETAAVSNV